MFEDVLVGFVDQLASHALLSVLVYHSSGMRLQQLLQQHTLKRYFSSSATDFWQVFSESSIQRHQTVLPASQK
jgi:hypothetical protein